jgi:hypothetical protein
LGIKVKLVTNEERIFSDSSLDINT